MTTVDIKRDPMKEFQDKVTEKLRDNIRDMLPQDVLDTLVNRAVDETFFKDRVITGRYGNDDRKPSWFVEQVTRSAQGYIEAEVNKFIDERKDVIDKALSEFLSENKLTVAFATILAGKIENSMMSMSSQIINSLAR